MNLCSKILPISHGKRKVALLIALFTLILATLYFDSSFLLLSTTVPVWKNYGVFNNNNNVIISSSNNYDKDLFEIDIGYPTYLQWDKLFCLRKFDHISLDDVSYNRINVNGDFSAFLDYSIPNRTFKLLHHLGKGCIYNFFVIEHWNRPWKLEMKVDGKRVWFDTPTQFYFKSPQFLGGSKQARSGRFTKMPICFNEEILINYIAPSNITLTEIEETAVCVEMNAPCPNRIYWDILGQIFSNNRNLSSWTTKEPYPDLLKSILSQPPGTELFPVLLSAGETLSNQTKNNSIIFRSSNSPILLTNVNQPLLTFDTYYSKTKIDNRGLLWKKCQLNFNESVEVFSKIVEHPSMITYLEFFLSNVTKYDLADNKSKAEDFEMENKWHQLKLQVWFDDDDDETKPMIDAHLSNFFGMETRQSTVRRSPGLMIGRMDNRAYCNFPMPFQE